MAMRLTTHATNRFERARALRRAVVGGACVLGLLAALASLARAAEPTGTAEASAHQALVDALAPSLAARGATAEISVPPSDARRNLAPCRQFAASLPPGARLAGRTLVAVRCIDGAAWQAFVPADVKLSGPAWETTRALRSGDVLGAADLRAIQGSLGTADIDVAGNRNAAASRGVATLDGRVPAPVGRTVQRPVAAGRALAAADLRDEGRINPGDPVRVVYQGAGFSVASEGHAVGAADPGANVLIRLASGTVVNGMLRADHLVELPR